jgi:hypothetical protein
MTPFKTAGIAQEPAIDTDGIDGIDMNTVPTTPGSFFAASVKTTLCVSELLAVIARPDLLPPVL